MDAKVAQQGQRCPDIPQRRHIPDLQLPPQQGGKKDWKRSVLSSGHPDLTREGSTAYYMESVQAGLTFLPDDHTILASDILDDPGTITS